MDAFGWLHRGAVACAVQLAFDKPTNQYVTFVVNRVRMLLDFGITPYMVFDGDAVPSKSGTNAKRRKDREAAKELGISLYRSGKREQAFQELQKAVTVTPQMTFTLIEELRRMNVQVLVAPYEADAQLTYLEKEGIIDGILSEDSDLLVFGAKKLITKLDQYGSCVEINREDLILNKDISFAGFSDTMFRRMAILSGCDYLPSVNGVGLRKGHEFVKKHKEITKIVRVMSLKGKFVVPADYVTKFQDAERTFLYHRVFCPKEGKMIFLNTLPPDMKEEDMPYLGVYVESEVALGIACGDLNPKTKEKFPLSWRDVQSATRTSTLQETRRQTMGGSTDLKSKRSIDSFFQSHRRPLAELDPNSLTPSPSQQRLLERHRNASWQPRHVNSAPQLRRAVTDVPRSSFTVQPTHDRMTSFLSRASAVSTYKPVKRQRLCSELNEVSPSKEEKQSKFFAPTVVEDSPLRSKTKRDRKMKSTGFDVFSDDSTDSILFNFAVEVDQADQGAIKYPELPEIPAEEGTAVEDRVPLSSPIKAQAALIDSQSSHGTAELQHVSIHSQAEEQSGVPTDLNECNDPETFADRLDYHVNKMGHGTAAQRLDRTFSNQSQDRQSAALACLKSEHAQAQHVAEVEDSERDFEPDAEDLVSPKAVVHTKFQSVTRTFTCQSPELQSRALQSLGKYPAISNMVHETSILETYGTEDAIPRSSQDEVSEAEETKPKLLDVKKFQYVASS